MAEPIRVRGLTEQEGLKLPRIVRRGSQHGAVPAGDDAAGLGGRERRPGDREARPGGRGHRATRSQLYPRPRIIDISSP